MIRAAYVKDIFSLELHSRLSHKIDHLHHLLVPLTIVAVESRGDDVGGDRLKHLVLCGVVEDTVQPE